MAKKAYQYMEITFPQSVIDDHGGTSAVGIMRALLSEYIAETDDKNGRICRDFVFDEIKAFEWKENVGAFVLGFINERNRQTYYKARENYTAWLQAKGVETTHFVTYDVPFDVLSENPDSDFNATYADVGKNYIMEELPTQRGFTAE